MARVAELRGLTPASVHRRPVPTSPRVVERAPRVTLRRTAPRRFGRRPPRVRRAAIERSETAAAGAPPDGSVGVAGRNGTGSSSCRRVGGNGPQAEPASVSSSACNSRPTRASRELRGRRYSLATDARLRASLRRATRRDRRFEVQSCGPGVAAADAADSTPPRVARSRALPCVVRGCAALTQTCEVSGASSGASRGLVRGVSWLARGAASGFVDAASGGTSAWNGARTRR